MSPCCAKRTSTPLRARGSSSTTTTRTPVLPPLLARLHFLLCRAILFQPDSRLPEASARRNDDHLRTKHGGARWYWKVQFHGPAFQIFSHSAAHRPHYLK